MEIETSIQGLALEIVPSRLDSQQELIQNLVDDLPYVLLMYQSLLSQSLFPHHVLMNKLHR